MTRKSEPDQNTFKSEVQQKINENVWIQHFEHTNPKVVPRKFMEG